MSAFEDASVVCDVLDALAVNLDGSQAAPEYFCRRRVGLRGVMPNLIEGCGAPTLRPFGKKDVLSGTGRVLPAPPCAASPGPNGPGGHVPSDAIWSSSQRAGGVAAAVAASAALRRWRSASGMASAWCRAVAVSLTS